jgi:hypothetical protein
MFVWDRVFDPVGRCEAPHRAQCQLWIKSCGPLGRLTGSKTRSHTIPPSPRQLEMLARAAGNGGDQQHFVSVLKCILVSAEEADVFFVHVHIEEAANFS